MESLAESPFKGKSLTFKPKHGISSGFLKVLVTGELDAQGADRRLMMKVNGASSGYQGFVLMTGHAGMGEWDNSGFYLGRNGWFLDATVMAEVTLAINPTAQKITAVAQSTFGHGNNTILGYECHGFVATNQPINSVEIGFTGGVVTGISRFFLL